MCVFFECVGAVCVILRDGLKFVFVLCFVLAECVLLVGLIWLCFVCNEFYDVVCGLSVWRVIVACFMSLCIIFAIYCVNLSGLFVCVLLTDYACSVFNAFVCFVCAVLCDVVCVVGVLVVSVCAVV